MKFKEIHRTYNLLSKTQLLLNNKSFLLKAPIEIIEEKRKIIKDCNNKLKNNLESYLKICEDFNNKSERIKKCLWRIEYKRELFIDKNIDEYSEEWFNYIYKNITLDEFMNEYDDFLEEEKRFNKYFKVMKEYLNNYNYANRKIEIYRIASLTNGINKNKK